MDIGSILLGLALLLVIGFVIARPLFEQAAVTDVPASPADQLLASREQVLTQLRDLDFDHAMSKINDVDYAAQRVQLVSQGVALLKQLDALGVAPDDAATGAANAPASAPANVTANAAAPAAAPADEIEAAVAQRRAQRVAPSRAASLPAAPLQARVTAPPATPDPNSAALSLDAQIEASVAERRARKPAPTDASETVDVPAAAGKVFCGQCGTQAQPGDRFCARCGAALQEPAAPLRQAKLQS